MAGNKTEGISVTAAQLLDVKHGVVAVTGTLDVPTGLSTVLDAQVSMQDDPDGLAMMVASVTVGNQSGAPAAGSIRIKVWKATAAGNAALIAATAAKNINWIAFGTA